MPFSGIVHVIARKLSGLGKLTYWIGHRELASQRRAALCDKSNCQKSQQSRSKPLKFAPPSALPNSGLPGGLAQNGVTSRRMISNKNDGIELWYRTSVRNVVIFAIAFSAPLVAIVLFP
jgi:hypothetical protein